MTASFLANTDHQKENEKVGATRAQGLDISISAGLGYQGLELRLLGLGLGFFGFRGQVEVTSVGRKHLLAAVGLLYRGFRV